MHDTQYRAHTTVHAPHTVPAVFTALCCVHSRAVSVSRSASRPRSYVVIPFVWCGFSPVCAAAVCCVHVARFRASAVAGTTGTDLSGRDFLEGRRHRGVARVGAWDGCQWALARRQRLGPC